MPELRQDYATKEWVIIATERAKRPHDFLKGRKEPEPLPNYDPNCPFCPGNEHMTPPETFAIRNGTLPNTSDWRVRVVPNKFPALVPDGRPKRTRLGLYLRMDGVGHHEVVIESPEHDKTLALLPNWQVEDVVRAYLSRYRALNANPSNELVLIFRNQGEKAGTSLVHPHSQIVATPIVPVPIRRALYEAERHYDALGRCVFCDILEHELECKERIVAENEHFVAFVPYAARVPFEVHILPSQHQASFGELPDEQVNAFAAILKLVLSKLYFGLKNPDYNFAIITAPQYSQGEPHFHWNLKILPRLTTPAGFEIGSGMYINIALPEENAKFLREQEVPEG
ncbi:MAG: galactose-1-phosphate uridylyltransferase [Armatimonadetes bacterium]|nr:galactose-1-phosphate uridylyltransferase [Armatimonadota bacterium]MDW8028299.1 galactose-1-phosphate uridylyltransferase [Armatimonadota bacterium]